MGTFGVGSKSKTIGEVVEGIHEEQEIVVAAKIEIAAQGFHHVRPIQFFVTNGQEVHVLIIVQHAYFRAYLGFAGIHGEYHVKIRYHFRLAPSGVVAAAIYFEGAVGAVDVVFKVGVFLLGKKRKGSK